MENTLYVIYNAGSKIYLNYISECKLCYSLYVLNDPYVPNKTVEVSSLYKYIDGYMFGNDKDKLIEKWNEYHDVQAGYMKIRMLQHKSYIVHKEDYDFVVADKPKLKSR